MTNLAIARVCHAANNAYNLYTGDPLLPDWDALETSYRESSIAGVVAAIEGRTPAQLHESWMAERTAAGWVRGDVLDRAAKVHPNLVPYDELPPMQRRKDELFVAIVTALVPLNRPKPLAAGVVETAL